MQPGSKGAVRNVALRSNEDLGSQPDDTPFGAGDAERTLIHICILVHSLVVRQEAMASAEAQSAVGGYDLAVSGGGAGSAQAMYNAASQDPTLTHRLLRALGVGTGSRPPHWDVAGMTQQTFGAIDQTDRKHVIAPWAASQVLLKMANPLRGSGSLQGLVARTMEANAVVNDTMWELNMLMGISVSKMGQRVPTYATLEGEAASVLERLDGKAFIMMLFDNINFKNLIHGLNHGTATGRHIVYMAWSTRTPEQAAQHRTSLVGVSDEPTTMDALLASHGSNENAAAFLVGGTNEDTLYIDQRSMERAAAIIYLLCNPNDKDNVGLDEQKEYKVNEVIPGRSSLTPKVIREPGFAMEVKEDHRDAGPAATASTTVTDVPRSGDLNKATMVRSILDFSNKIFRKMCERGAGSGEIDEECFLWRMGFWLACDGHPGGQLVDMINAKPEKYKNLFVNTGAFHWNKAAWNLRSKLFRPTVGEELIRPHRGSPKKQDWYFSPSDPRQVIREEGEKAAAFWIDQHRAMLSDPEYAGKRTICDLLQRAYKRAAVCPLAYVALADNRLVETLLAMEDSTRNGGNLSMYCAMERIVHIMGTVTNAKIYAKLGVYDRETLLTISEQCYKTFEAFVWLQVTESGETCASDMWVELQVNKYRFTFGNKWSRGMVQRLLAFSATMDAARELKGTDSNKTTIDADGEQRRSAGVLVTTAVLRLTGEQYRRFNTAGYGGIHTDVHVVNPQKKNALLTFKCDTLVTLSGQPMMPHAFEWMATGRQRLAAIYMSKHLDGPAVQPHHIKTLVVSAVGSAKHAFFLQLRLLSTRDTELIGTNKESTCECGCGEKTFNKKGLTAALIEIREYGGVTAGRRGDLKLAGEGGGGAAHTALNARQHVTRGHQADVEADVMLEITDQSLLASIPTTNPASGSFTGSNSDLAALLGQLRLKAGLDKYRPTRPTKADAVTYARGTPSTAAMKDPIFHNALAFDVAAATAIFGTLPVYEVKPTAAAGSGGGAADAAAAGGGGGRE